MLFSKKSTSTPENLFAILDVGTSKICCAIAKTTQQYLDTLANHSIKNNGNIRLIAAATQLSKGVKGGVITDMDALEDSVLNVLHNAENMAHCNISKVYLNLPAEVLQSHFITVEISLHGQLVTDQHLSRLFNINKDQHIGNRQLIHIFPLRYCIDDISGVTDPRGMSGEVLQANLHVISASTSYIRNLTTCLWRCHLDIAAFVSAPYAAGLSTLVEDEINLGVTVVDIGGSHTNFASFINGQLVCMGALPIGGLNVTNDIARVLAVPISQSERLKTLYGSLLITAADEKENILISQMGEEHSMYTNQVTKGILTKIIRARVEELLELLLNIFNQSKLDPVVFQKIVLTGGGSQLQGIRELANHVLARQVRLGTPQGIVGVGDIVHSTSFAVSAGMLHYALQDYLGQKSNKLFTNTNTSIWQKLTHWLK